MVGRGLGLGLDAAYCDTSMVGRGLGLGLDAAYCDTRSLLWYTYGGQRGQG